MVAVWWLILRTSHALHTLVLFTGLNFVHILVLFTAHLTVYVSASFTLYISWWFSSGQGHWGSASGIRAHAAARIHS